MSTPDTVLARLKQPWILYGLCRLHVHFVLPRLRLAWGLVALRRVARRGTGCRVNGRVTLYDPDQLELGDYVRIGEGSFLFCKGGLTIGSNTQISRNVCIYTANNNVEGDMTPKRPVIWVRCSLWEAPLTVGPEMSP